ncbi:MAG: membrane protein insertion efficiency factor YidD [Planctomycetota bacterium]
MSPTWLRTLWLLPVHLYRRVISPLKPPTCRFHPTCSHYCVEAVHTRGILVGTALSIWRLLRCQPFARGGYDPVPPASVPRDASRPQPNRTSE